MDTPQVKIFEAVWLVYGSAGIIAAGVVFGLFMLTRYFVVKLVEAKITQRLESFKHAQQVEMEGLKYKINNLADRASKIYLKEYEHLPNVWISLNEAFRSASLLTGSLRQYPNLDMATATELEAFLSNSDLHDWQKDKLRQSSNKIRVYMDILSRREHARAVDDHFKLRENIDKYAIFFSKDIKRELEGFGDMLWSAIVEFEVYSLDKLDGERPVREARAELRDNGRTKLEGLEEKIRDRLWNADSAAPLANPPAT